MSQYLVIIVIVVVLIIIYMLKGIKPYDEIKCEQFQIHTDANSGDNVKYINEIYQIPCIGCLRSDNSLKPGFKYHLSDDRCVENTSNSYVDGSSLLGMVTYDSDPSMDYHSCESTYNSLYSIVNGRYIRIIRNDNTPIKIKHISVHGRLKSSPSLSTNKFIFVNPIYKNISGIISYPDEILDSSDSIINTFQTGSKSPYVHIDLGNNMDIAFIIIKHNNIQDAGSLNGAYILVLEDNDESGEDGTLVFHKQIIGTDMERTIYTQNYKNPNLPVNTTNTMKMINTYTWPCEGCITSSQHLFKNHKYNVGERCVKPLNFDSYNTDLDNIDTLDSNIIENKFMSCNSQFDTRFLPAFGRFIQFYRTSGDIAIKFSKITIYSSFNYDTNVPISAYVHAIKDSNSVFAKALDSDYTTEVSTSDTNEAMIHIDLGTNKNIVGMKIETLKNGEPYINGIICYVIKIDIDKPFDISSMKVKYSITIDQSVIDRFRDSTDPNVNSYIIPIIQNVDQTVSDVPTITLNREVTYDPSNKYLSTHVEGDQYYQIPYIIYKMNNRRMLAKTNAIATKLDRISNSDGSILFNIDNDIDLSPYPIANSYILNPISGRYVQLIENGILTLNNAVGNITVYNSSKEVIKTISNPKVLYDIPLATYNKYLTDIIPAGITPSDRYILIDLLQDTMITFIKVELVNNTYLSNLDGSILRIVNDIGNKVFSYVFSNSMVLNYVITDINEVNVTGTFYDDNYAYPQCKNAGTCDAVVPNKSYILSNGLCYKANSSIDPTCTVATCLDVLSTFGLDNMINIVDNNFSTCIIGKDTRFDLSNINVSWKPSEFSYITSMDDTTPTAYNVSVKTWKSIESSMFKFTKSGNDNATLKIWRSRPCIQMYPTSNYNSFIGPDVKFLNILLFIAFDDRQSNGTTNTAPIMLWHNRLDGYTGEYQFYMNRVLDDLYNIGFKTVLEIPVTITGATNSYAILGIQIRLSGTTATFKYITKDDIYVTTRTTILTSQTANALANAVTSLTLNAPIATTSAINSGSTRFYNIYLQNRTYTDTEMITLRNNIKTYMTVTPAVLFDLDASDPNTLFQDIGKTIPSNVSNIVKYWSDKSVYGNNAIKGSGGGSGDRILRSPIFWNNKYIIEFNRDCLALTEPKIQQGHTECTVFMVSTYGDQCISPLNSQDNDINGLIYVSYAVVVNMGASSNKIITNSPPSGPFVIAMVLNETTGTKYYINNINTTDNTATFYGYTDKKYTIGGCIESDRTNAFGFNGLLGEIKIYNTALSATTTPTLQSAFNDFNDKWGVTNFFLRGGTNILPLADYTTGKKIAYSGRTLSMVNDTTRGFVMSSAGNNYITTTESYYHGPHFTKMCWVKIPDHTGTYAIMSSAAPTLSGFHGFLIYTGWIQLYFNSITTNLILYDTPKIPINTWTHIAVSFNNVTKLLNIYINGISVKSTVYMASLISPTVTAQLSFLALYQNTNYFNGLIDDLYFFNRVLSDTEVISYKNTSRGTSMVGRYIYLTGYRKSDNLPVGSIEVYNGTTRYLATSGEIIGGSRGVWSDLNGDGLTQNVTINNSRSSLIKLDLGENKTITSIVIKPAISYSVYDSTLSLVNNNGDIVNSVYGLQNNDNVITNGYNAPVIRYSWNATTLSSLFKNATDNATVVGDQIIKWQPSIGTVNSNTTFTRHTAGDLYPTLITKNSKYAVNIPAGVILTMPNSEISAVTKTVFVALRWVSAPGDSIPMSYITPGTGLGSSYLYQFNTNTSLFVSGSSGLSIGTTTVTIDKTYIYMFSYNAYTSEYKVIVTGSNISKIINTAVNSRMLMANGYWNLGGVRTSDAGGVGWGSNTCVHEMRVYRDYLTDSDINSISAEMLTTWA